MTESGCAVVTLGAGMTYTPGRAARGEEITDDDASGVLTAVLVVSR